jgi:uncharacterized membrane protein
MTAITTTTTARPVTIMITNDVVATITISLASTLVGAGGTGWFAHGPPPLHPILVNFTAALLPASVVSDVLGRWRRKPSLTAAGWWMLCYAAIVTPFTALAGWMWLRQMSDMDVQPMTIHKWLGTGLIVVFTALAFWRWRIHRRANEPPSALYLMCAAVVVVLLTVQGHLGGKMSFDTGHTVDGPAAATHNSASDHGAWSDHINVKD